MQASGSSHVTPVASASLPYAWNGAWSHQVFTNDATVVLPHKTKVTKAMRCEVCKIDCNTADVYEKHILGKKHKKNLQVWNNPTTALLPGPSHANVHSSTSGIQGQVQVGAEGEELESKKRKDLSGGTPMDSVKICTVCNVMCNSEDTYSKHLAGKRHTAQVNCKLNYPFVRLHAMLGFAVLPNIYIMVVRRERVCIKQSSLSRNYAFID